MKISNKMSFTGKYKIGINDEYDTELQCKILKKLISEGEALLFNYSMLKEKELDFEQVECLKQECLEEFFSIDSYVYIEKKTLKKRYIKF